MRTTRHKLKLLRNMSRASASSFTCNNHHHHHHHHHQNRKGSSSVHNGSWSLNGSPQQSKSYNVVRSRSGNKSVTSSISSPNIINNNHSSLQAQHHGNNNNILSYQNQNLLHVNGHNENNNTRGLHSLSSPHGLDLLGNNNNGLELRETTTRNNSGSSSVSITNFFITCPEPSSSASYENFINSSAMEPVSATADVRIKAFAICKDYLHGAWKQIEPKDLVLKRISGGLSNWLYHCSLPSSLFPITNEPTQVLLRFYGQVHGEGALESVITESVIFTLLSERKLGPKLYGVFPGGRIEQFIPARPLKTKELRDPEISHLIAQKTAQIHGLNIPISKEPVWLWDTLDRWLATIHQHIGDANPSSPEQKEVVRQLMSFDLDAELLWLKEFLPRLNSPVVFSHNDLQEGNILIRAEHEGPQDKLVLIDFEYCSYNYRGFDLANHFCEWTYCYNVRDYPNFEHYPDGLPSLKQRTDFIQTYVSTLRKEYEMNCPDVDESFMKTSTLFDEEHIVKEVEGFHLASHFFWSLWSLVNAQVSKIPFGYWEYGLTRLNEYSKEKEKFL